ncbi:hypothetical protein CTI12_AA017160 [Artemisia annua]|uniref:Helitron helicase-like domain-containing protein n=1 Tax=Artemisia annua TaxID=35608 RepID=A0A2U1QKS8_ARTAN|nr:hypothetical protein CTI12_AA017160 [Artemisia annua]
MKTKQKAIRRTPSASDFVSSDLSPAFEPVYCSNQPLKRKYPSTEGIVLTTSSTNSTKKIRTTNFTVDQPEPEFISDALSANGCLPCSCHTHDPCSSSMSCQCQHRRSNAPNSSGSQDKYMHNRNLVNANPPNGHTTSSTGKRKRHSRITAASPPTQIQGTKVISNSTSSNTRGKRPRFIQVATNDLPSQSSILRTYGNQQRRLRQVVEDLIRILDEHNNLVKLFRTARDKIESGDVPNFKLKLFGVVGSRQYDIPAGDSIGAIVFEGGPDVKTDYDVVIERRGGSHKELTN